MNWDVIESNWKQFTDVVKEQWSKLSDDDLQRIAGRRDRLGAQIAETYGVSHEEAEKQLQSFETSNITYKGAIKARTYARITSAEADYMDCHNRMRHPIGKREGPVHARRRE